MRIITLSLFIVIIFSLLTGCSPPKPEDIIGEWIPADDSPKIIKNAFLPKPIHLVEQPYFIFNPDGTFIAGNMPKAIISFRSEIDIISGKGNWSIERYQGSDIVRLKFTEGVSMETYIHISRGIKTIKLFDWLGEEGGDRFNFVKKPE